MSNPSSNFGRDLFATVCLGSLLSAGVFAQEAEQEATNDRRLKKVTVTAQKQETNLQETPIAITAISEEVLSLQGVVDVTDISGMAPNLTVNTGILTASQAVIGIRGVSASADEMLTLDGPVGLYIDGVYIGRSAGAALEVADIEQVEVLRGPQGTLFGRNTTGGAINFITRRPEAEQSFSTSAGLGDTNGRSLSATVHSGELENGVRLSGTLNFYGIDGDTDNKFTDKDKDPNAFTSTATRFGVEFDPNPETNVYYSFDYATFEQYAPAFQTTIASPTVTNFLKYSTTTEGCSLAVEASAQDEYCLDDSAPTENTTFGHMLKIEREFSNFTLRSTTGIRKWENTIDDSDLDGFGEITGNSFTQTSMFNGLPAALTVNILCRCATPTDAQRTQANAVAGLAIPTIKTSLYSASNKREQDQWSQEFELIDTQKGDKFDWVVGAFYFHEESSEDNNQVIGYVLDMEEVLGAPSFGAAATPLVNAHKTAHGEEGRYRARHTEAKLVYTTDADSLALYGQGTYRADGPEGKLGWTFGLRYSSDKKSIKQTQSFEKTDELDDSAVTGHLTADYRFSPDFNGYAKYARGYKSGGFNARVNQDPFEAEYLDAFEVGFKSEVSDGTVRINGAIFQSKYTDQQVVSPTQTQPGQGFQNLILNAGKRDYTGIELEFLAQPSDQLTLNASLGTVDIKTKEWPYKEANKPSMNIADEIVPSNVPKLTINAGGIYRWDMTNGDMTGRLNITHEGSRYFFPNPRESTFTKMLQADARTLIDFQLRWDNISVNRGRSNAYVMLWIKNLTDEAYETRAIDYGALGYGGFIYGNPRSFGVNVGVTW